jgi:uncharacterized protein (TIGR03067 family)
MMRTAVLVACVLALAADDKKADKKSNPVSGVWYIASLTEDGREIKEATGAKVTFKDGKMITEPPGAPAESTEFRLIDGQDPAAIDIAPQVVTVGGGAKKNVEMTKCIYLVKNGELRICMPTRGKDRPKDFAAKAGVGVITLRREKP